MENLLGTKIGALAVIFLLALLSGLLPIKLRYALFKSSRISEKYTLITLSASLCCGAGILMATVFLHILRETRDGFRMALEKGIISEVYYSLAEILMCSGFFLIYFLEELVHVWVHRRHPKLAQEDGSDEVECCQFNRMSSINIGRAQTRVRCNSLPLRSNSLTCMEEIDNPSHADLHQTMKQELEGQSNNNYNDIRKDSASANISSASSNRELEKKTVEENLVRSFLVIIALSLHGAFEGLSLGLENSTTKVWLLCMALSAHKVFIAFSIGMEMLEEGVNKTIYLFQMLVFSLASPIGGTLGLTLTASIDQDAGIIIITVLKGISGGTILYVTFCEVLERERTKMSGRFIRLFALIFGFAIMAGLQAIAFEHEHGEPYQYNSTKLNYR